MGDFDTTAALLRNIARRPTAQQQRQARQDGLKPFVQAAKANLAANGSNKTYKLSEALGTAEQGRNTTAAGPVRGKKHATVGHLVEFGTAPHWQPNRGGGTMHPGARAKPFMRPAFDETKGEVVEAAGRSLIQSIFGR